MQLDLRRRPAGPMRPGGALSTPDPSLRKDAEAFSEVLESLARIYQLQDPRQTCSYGITLTECYALEAVVRKGPITVKEVATALSLDKSTASRALSSLAAKGYVRRRGNRKDGREVEARPTATGERLYLRIRVAGRRRHRELLGKFSPESRLTATALLRLIASAESARTSAPCEPCP